MFLEQLFVNEQRQVVKKGFRSLQPSWAVLPCEVEGRTAKWTKEGWIRKTPEIALDWDYHPVGEESNLGCFVGRDRHSQCTFPQHAVEAVGF